MNNEIILYELNELTKIEVKVVNETVWLNRHQISHLFNKDIKTIGKHINNVFGDGELNKESTVANFATVQNEGGRKILRDIEYLNLDVIISVGYRVKSKEGTLFRIWANRVLKEYLLQGYSLNKRMNRIENNVDSISKRVGEIDIQIKSSLKPKQGVFFDGQIFDAHKLISDIIRSATKSIILFDNYVDDTVLNVLSKKDKKVNCTIFSKSISKQLNLDIEKFNKQYPTLDIRLFDKAHDRFLIIDEMEIYHIGASLKDLGKKWFAFTKLDKDSLKMTKLVLDIIGN